MNNTAAQFKVTVFTNEGEKFASVEHVDSATGRDFYADGTEQDWQDNNGLEANNTLDIVAAAREAAEAAIDA